MGPVSCSENFKVVLNFLSHKELCHRLLNDYENVKKKTLLVNTKSYHFGKASNRQFCLR